MIPSRSIRAIKKGMGLEVEPVPQDRYSIYDEDVERIGRSEDGYYAVLRGIPTQRVYITPEEFEGLDKRMMREHRESMSQRTDRRWKEMNDMLERERRRNEAEDARLRSILGPPPQSFSAGPDRVTGRCRQCGHDLLIPLSLAQVTCPGCQTVYNIERAEPFAAEIAETRKRAADMGVSLGDIDETDRLGYWGPELTQCSVCGMRFDTKRTLDTHARTHRHRQKRNSGGEEQ